MELPRGLVERARHWLHFVGPVRVAAGAVASVAALVIAAFMFLPAAPQVESALPLAAPSGASVPAPTSSMLPAFVRVHVAGAVRKPGVYRLRSVDRVVDAVRAAGGAAAGADLDAINLAQTILDTEQIYVPHKAAGSRRAPAPRLVPRRRTAATSPAPAPSGGTTAVPSSTIPARININIATAAQLETLPGVGPTTAKAIIAYRQSKGPFARVDDLLNVPGIGPSKLDAMRGMIET